MLILLSTSNACMYAIIVVKKYEIGSSGFVTNVWARSARIPVFCLAIDCSFVTNEQTIQCGRKQQESDPKLLEQNGDQSRRVQLPEKKVDSCSRVHENAGFFPQPYFYIF